MIDFADDSSSYGMLPYAPIWTGLVMNTLLYAAMLWVLMGAPFVVRRWRRQRTGRCFRCGYDLRGADHEVCPECGAEVLASMRKPPAQA